MADQQIPIPGTESLAAVPHDVLWKRLRRLTESPEAAEEWFQALTGQPAAKRIPLPSAAALDKAEDLVAGRVEGTGRNAWSSVAPVVRAAIRLSPEYRQQTMAAIEVVRAKAEGRRSRRTVTDPVLKEKRLQALAKAREARTAKRAAREQQRAAI